MVELSSLEGEVKERRFSFGQFLQEGHTESDHKKGFLRKEWSLVTGGEERRGTYVLRSELRPTKGELRRPDAAEGRRGQ